MSRKQLAKARLELAKGARAQAALWLEASQNPIFPAAEQVRYQAIAESFHQESERILQKVRAVIVEDNTQEKTA